MNPFAPARSGIAQLFRSLPLSAPPAVASLLVQIAVAKLTWPVLGDMALYVSLALLLFAHAAFVHLLSAWPMGREAGLGAGVLLGRAGMWGLAWTGMAGGGLAFWTAARAAWPSLDGSSFDWPLSRDMTWIAILLAWAAWAGSGLPSRLMLGRARVGWDHGWSGRVLASMVAVSPWLILFTLLSAPARMCRGECWGVFEGGMVMAPLLGALMFLMSAGAAAVSAAVHRASTS